MDASLLLIVAILVPLINGLVQLAKTQGLSDRRAPVAAVVFGLMLAWLVSASNTVEGFTRHDPGYIILVGLIAGMTAAGVYRSAKVLIEGR